MVRKIKLGHKVTGELGAATSCPPSSEGAGQKRTSTKLRMKQRAVLRLYLHGIETIHKSVRYADDVRHLTRC